MSWQQKQMTNSMIPDFPSFLAASTAALKLFSPCPRNSLKLYPERPSLHLPQELHIHVHKLSQCLEICDKQPPTVKHSNSLPLVLPSYIR